VVAKVVPLGLVTTPQLHYVVMQSNGPTPEKANVKSYYEQFCAAFRELIPEGKTITPTLIDCANGVGKLAGAEFKARLSDVFAMDLYNTGDTNLNDLCGAEFVQKQRKFPRSFKGDEMAGKKMCAVDGDADRLVYFYVDEKSGELALLDGDKITCLVAGYIKQLLVKAGLVEKVSMGIVQTAYANGASTKYMQNDLKVDVQMAKTGVKYIHHKAAECFEIGVYFEANGHGTVIFGFAAQRAFANELTALQREPEKLDPELWSSDDEVESSDENKNSNGYANLSADDKASRIQAIQQLQAVTRLVNPAVGDAFADMLLVEIILTTQGMTLQDWGALYQDFPSRMLKTKVPDRTAVITTNAERTCTAPVGLQAAVDKLVANPDNTSARRAFVCPSGTEDAVRIYAEADTQADADALAQAITEKVNEFCSK
jgi:phosphoacetylglucosamine mutase